MSELKLPRLLAAAKEFNIGQDTLIDFLAKKGFSKDELKPAAKLSEPMYYALQAEFQNDKQAKNKADLVEIPKSQQNERRKRDEEDLSFRKDFKKPFVKEEPKKTEDVAVFHSAQPHTTTEDIVVPQKQVVPSIQLDNTPKVVEDNFIKAEVKPATPVVDNWSSVVKIEAPELEGPKIINKIDLSTIDSSTRPKKATHRPDEKEIVTVQPVAPKAEIPTVVTAPIVQEEVKSVVVETVVVKQPVEIPLEKPAIVVEKAPEVFEHKIAPTPEVIAPPPPRIETPVVTIHSAPETIVQSNVSNEEAPLIENIQAEKLTGPKILGKIELPIDSDTRPKPSSADDKKKRKRIPVDNRKVGGGHRQHNHPHPGNQGFNQGQNPNQGQNSGQGHRPSQGYNPNQGPNSGQGSHPNQGHPNQGQTNQGFNHGNQGHGHFQNRGPYQNNQGGGFNRDRENRPVGSPNQHPNHPPQAPGTGTTRPIVPANNRGGGTGG